MQRMNRVLKQQLQKLEDTLLSCCLSAARHRRQPVRPAAPSALRHENCYRDSIIAGAAVKVMETPAGRPGSLFPEQILIQVDMHNDSTGASQTQEQVSFVAVDGNHEGQRLDNFLQLHLRGVPKSRIYRMIRKGEVRVNRKRSGPDLKLAEGDLVRIPPARIKESNVVIPSANLESVKGLKDAIVFESESLVIINKPAGLAAHGGSGVSFGAVEAMRSLYGEHSYLELVHRIDRETSGCLMFAKKRSALRSLQQQFRERTVHKQYLALVRGEWSNRVKFVDAPLVKNIIESGERMVKVDEVNGAPSRTEFRIIRKYGPATLVEASPKTGRTHQIRVHCQFMTHPIAGDAKYGDRHFDEEMRNLGLRRMFLHAFRIQFEDPDTGKEVTVEAPLPPELQDVIEKLGPRE